MAHPLTSNTPTMQHSTRDISISENSWLCSAWEGAFRWARRLWGHACWVLICQMKVSTSQKFNKVAFQRFFHVSFALTLSDQGLSFECTSYLPVLNLSLSQNNVQRKVLINHLALSNFDTLDGAQSRTRVVWGLCLFIRVLKLLWKKMFLFSFGGGYPKIQ